MTHPRSGGEPYLTKRELACALKCSARTIERIGIRPDLVVGGQNRYYRSSAEAQLRGVPPKGGTVISFPRERARGAAA